MKNIIIDVKDLNYKNIFYGFNITFYKSDFIAIVGSNSCGKTILLKAISTLISTSNTIFYKKKPIENINKRILFNEIGFVILEENISFMHNTVEEEIFFIIDNLNYPQKDKIMQYQYIIKMLNIENILNDNPNNLNRFLKIKLLLASTLLSKPKILLLDDICSTFTKKETNEILNILKELNRNDKITIIMTTHNLYEVINVDYLYILDKGKICIEGKPCDILKEDNTINRLGLSIPFMMDLSVKLGDYDLINDVEFDMDRMIDKLWK